MLESAIQRKLIKGVQALGGVALKIEPVSHVGIPDTLVVLPGPQWFLIEVKKPEGLRSPVQINWHAQFHTRTGVPVLTLYGSDEVAAWLKAVTP